ncbi:MAG: hypothetical protein HYU67_08695 [Flavobacteriia bacterium]|nr:hypothetical protein [Flavobacteriia bacterium]
MSRTNLLLLVSLITLNFCYSQIKTDSTDVSELVKVNNLLFMKKDLDIVTFRNGDTIPEAKTKKDWKKCNKLMKPAWCYSIDKENKICGKVYNWYAVNDSRKIAPEGYHVATFDEMVELIAFAKSKRYKNNFDFNRAPNRSSKGKYILGESTKGYWTSTFFDTNYSRCIYITLLDSKFGSSTMVCEIREGLFIKCVKD